ncbi:hypothetical protein BDN72DRAFT_858312 [Pluteus cervinus]|uniref:Uncharacterized protein n=1 Tax=Pluteus cervinus TaxID=181527 RepID=A0ACD3ASA2_9AGAR|nr:hypothetical protein BDN72DRAFT_858312 [Pluteus cervinus]
MDTGRKQYRTKSGQWEYGVMTSVEVIEAYVSKFLPSDECEHKIPRCLPNSRCMKRKKRGEKSKQAGMGFKKRPFMGDTKDLIEDRLRSGHGILATWQLTFTCAVVCGFRFVSPQGASLALREATVESRDRLSWSRYTGIHGSIVIVDGFEGSGGGCRLRDIDKEQSWTEPWNEYEDTEFGGVTRGLHTVQRPVSRWSSLTFIPARCFGDGKPYYAVEAIVGERDKRFIVRWSGWPPCFDCVVNTKFSYVDTLRYRDENGQYYSRPGATGWNDEWELTYDSDILLRVKGRTGASFTRRLSAEDDQWITASKDSEFLDGLNIPLANKREIAGEWGVRVRSGILVPFVFLDRRRRMRG